MKKIIFVLLGLVLIAGGVYFYLENNNGDSTEGVSYTEIVETEEGFITDMVIEKGDYEAGDVIYLSYTSESNETSLLDLFVIKVSALEEDDVIAYHEVTTEEVKTLKEKDLNVSVELALTDEDVEAIGVQNLSKHVRAKKVANNHAEQKLQVKNKYQVKEAEYIQYKAQKGKTDSGNGNTDAGNGNNQ